MHYRLFPEETYEIPDMEVQIHDLTNNVSEDILTRLKEAVKTLNSKSCNRSFTLDGLQNVNKWQLLWYYRDELSIKDDLIFKAEIKSCSKQAELLENLHAAHQEAEMTQDDTLTTADATLPQRRVPEANTCQQ